MECAAFVMLRAYFFPIMQPDPFRLRLTALVGFLSVVLGAKGAHGELHQKLVAAGELTHWQTAVQYHQLYSIVLLVMVLLASDKPLMKWAWRLFFAGFVLFSGSLYLLAYTRIGWLAHVTPVGGLSFMGGWLLLAMAAKGK